MKQEPDFCLSDEVIASYVEGKLPLAEKENIDRHVSLCPLCRQLLAAQSYVALRQKEEGLAQVPLDITRRAKDLVPDVLASNILQIAVEFSKQVLEVIKTNGMIIASPQLALRNGKAAEAKLLFIRKELGCLQVEAEISQQDDDLNTVIVKLKQDGRLVQDARITLLKENQEIESYISLNGEAVFSDLPQGYYRIEISRPEGIFGSIFLNLIKR